jgi:small conductance mechanosensitive channel
MPDFPPLDLIYRALIVAGVQLVVIAALLLLTSFVVGLLLRRADSISVLRKYREQGEMVRRRLNRQLGLLFVFLVFIVLAGNGYLLFHGVDLIEEARSRLLGLSTQFWIDLAIEFAKVIGIFIAAGVFARWIRKLLDMLARRAKVYKNLTTNDASIETFFTSLNRIQKTAIWLLAAYFAVSMLPFPPGAGDMLLLLLRVYLIIAVGMLALKAVAAVVQSLDALVARAPEPEKLLGLYDRLRGQMPLMRRCLEAVVYVLVATLVLAQVDFIAWLAAWGPPLIESIAIFFVSRVVVEISNLLVDKSMLEGKELDPGEQQGLETIVPVVKSILTFILYFIGFTLILRALSINPLPLLAGAGVVGIVVGLGAQSLINDVVSGLFILFERLFLVGDFIETGSARGTVESVQLRTTRIRDPNGQLHILRNGQLDGVINFSKDYTNAVVMVGVAYDSNLDQVFEVLGKAGETLKAGNANVIEATRVQGVDDFGESEITIRTVTRVKPGQHQSVAREYRKLIKEAFDREGIEIPFARRVIIFENDGVGPSDLQRPAF